MPAAGGRILLFGSSGQIGSALRAASSTNARGAEFRALPWSRIAAERLWQHPDGLLRAIDATAAGWDDFDVLLACGTTDAGAHRSSLIASNVALPLAVIDALTPRARTRFVTFGTVFEQFPAHAAGNAYLASKCALWDGLDARPALARNGRTLHLRLHTVYGGPPRPHMFLGQMVSALRDGAPFPMSSGQQLREYHHVDDIADAVLGLVSRSWNHGADPVVLSSGRPVRLADLASAVFTACGRPDLLRVGALPSAPTDNRDFVFPPSPPDLLPHCRDALTAVPEYVRAHLGIVTASA
jgi:nucleoside-diphosphate-sugar epimerase